MTCLIDAAAGRYRLLVAVWLFGGLRISEALGLVWDDVDLATGHLRVRHQLDRKGRRVKLKTSAGRRDVVLMDALASILRRHRLASRHHESSVMRRITMVIARPMSGSAIPRPSATTAAEAMTASET